MIITNEMFEKDHQRRNAVRMKKQNIALIKETIGNWGRAAAQAIKN